jgi:hypothetical protein
MESALKSYFKESDSEALSALGLPIEKARLEKLVEAMTEFKDSFEGVNPPGSRKGFFLTR